MPPRSSLHPPARPVPRHVLVCDDDAVYRTLLSRMVQTLGYDAEHAEDGDELLERCRQRPPCALIVDVGMPRLDGIEATRQLREAQSAGGLPLFAIIGCTGLTSPHDVERCLEAGMDRCLMKPVQLTRLAMALREGQERFGLRRSTDLAIDPRRHAAPAWATSGSRRR